MRDDFESNENNTDLRSGWLPSDCNPDYIGCGCFVIVVVLVVLFILFA